MHSNGFSLVNKILEQEKLLLTDSFDSSTLGETLLTPTKIYVKTVLEIINAHNVHGLCHVTGGGLTENLPRILPSNTCAEIRLNSWQQLPVFDWIQKTGKVVQEEMLRVFNCGIGMVVITSDENADSILQVCNKHQINADVIGEVKEAQGPSHVVYS